MPQLLGPTRIAVMGWVLLAAGPAVATWSIVAVDPETRQVGIAGASCIEGVDVIGGLAPGHGVIAAQAMSNPEARARGTEMLAEGRNPVEILGEITSNEFDPDHWIKLEGRAWQQYGVVSLDGPSQASFTGDKTFDWSGSMEAPGVVVAGNILVGPEVVASALLAFGTPSARTDCAPTMADRLVAALWAGAQAGGDRRCVEELSALSAFVAVANPDDPADSPSFRIVVPHEGPRERGLLRQVWRFARKKQGTAEGNPVRTLRGLYLAWSQRQDAPACLDRR